MSWAKYISWLGLSRPLTCTIFMSEITEGFRIGCGYSSAKNLKSAKMNLQGALLHWRWWINTQLRRQLSIGLWDYLKDISYVSRLGLSPKITKKTNGNRLRIFPIRKDTTLLMASPSPSAGCHTSQLTMPSTRSWKQAQECSYLRQTSRVCYS